MNYFTAEQITIALVLRYGKPTLKYCADLTADKFVHGKTGEIGGNDHAYIWQAIVDANERQVIPSIDSVGIERSYLRKLVSDLDTVHGIYEFNPQTLSTYVETVDKAGVVYQMSRVAGSVSALSMSKDIFYKSVDRIEDLTNWLTEAIQDYRDVYKIKKGYRHVSTVVEDIKADWDKMYKGEQRVILPVGMPTLQAFQLFPVNTFTILHGMSGSGKSAFLLAVLLGTAVGLKVNNIPGCVAVNSLEMTDKSFLSRAASILAGIDHTRLRGGKEPLSAEEFKRLNDWIDFVATLPFYVDDDNLLTSNELCLKALDIHSSENGPLLMLGSDYTELFTDDEDSMEQTVNKIAHNQFSIKKTTGASVIAISQSTYSEGNRYYIAGPNGIRYSRGATHAADIIVEIWNPIQMIANGIDVRIPDNLDSNSAWLLIEKFREGQVGQLRLGWEAAYTRYFDQKYVVDLGGRVKVFDHLERIAEAKYLMDKYHTAVPDVGDVWS